MAGVRPRGHRPVLCPAAARGRVHQIEPAENHRRRHRLAFLERAQTRAEGVNAKRVGRFPMQTTQTRRRFLTTASMAGAAGFVGASRVVAAEGTLETTSVRLPKVLGVCVSPQYAAEELLRAEGFTDVHYIETEAAGVA